MMRCLGVALIVAGLAAFSGCKGGDEGQKPADTKKPPQTQPTAKTPGVVSVPNVNVPKIDVPNVNVPKIDVPKVNLPTTAPTIKIPDVTLPKPTTLPTITPPKLPDVPKLPGANVPKLPGQ